MMQVKIIRCSASTMEGEINNFLLQLGSQVGYKVSINNIQLMHIGGQKDTEECCILYNAVRVMEDTPKPNQKQLPSPKQKYDPIHGTKGRETNP